MAPKQKTLLRKISLWLTLGGVIFAISPILYTLIFGALWNDFQGTSTSLWGLYATVPLGGIITLVGLVLLVVSIIRERK
jgi:multisubunit Na+/H+ antiporter MnhB subunit